MLKTFRIGGVHPPENKLSKDEQIITFPVPETVVIPLSQHIGAPAKSVVNKGDKVKVGDLIGQSAGFVSANIHSSVSGEVVSVGLVPDILGIPKECVTIKVEGDEWNESIDRSKTLNAECDLSSSQIVEKIVAAGIVGMGGATFPTHVKLSIPEGKNADYLVINGVECEPYLTSDHRVMLERGDELMIGVSILAKALNVKRSFIGIENNKPDAIQHLTSLTSLYPGIDIVPLKVQYPQGGEKQLIDAVLSRQVPSGKLPLDVQTVVQNIGTTLAVYEAVQKNKPVIERVVTVTGKSVTQPANFIVRIGTPLKSLLDYCGGLNDDTGKIIAGGPMMGKAVSNPDAPVTKGTSGVLVMSSKEAFRPQVETCIKCGKCVSACPMGLEPYLLGKLAKKGMYEQMEPLHITDCIECGCCTFSCPGRLPLLDYVRLGKMEVIKMIRNRKN